jgi:c-di-GMP-binding flagellar brake protein YcgR
MYTLLRVRPIGQERYCWSGHIYDLSLGGMRFELDTSLPPGTQVELRALLPGTQHLTVRAVGRVVRQHNAQTGERGPARMGFCFERFESRLDHERLRKYLAGRGIEPEGPQPTPAAMKPAGPDAEPSTTTARAA